MDNNKFIGSQFPAPIASSFWKAINLKGEGPSSYPKQQRFIYLFEVILKYTSCILLSYYRQRMMNVKEVEDGLDFLRRPQLGHWRALLRNLTRVFEQSDHVEPFIQKLTTAIAEKSKDSERRRQYQLAYKLLPRAASGRRKVSLGDIFDLLVEYRNSIAHGQFLQQPEVERHVLVLEELLSTVLMDLRCLAAYPLVHVKEVARQEDQNDRVELTRCMGGEREWDTIPFLTQSSLSAKHCYISENTEDGRIRPILDVHPFFIFTRCPEDYKEQIFSIVEGDDKKIEYIGCECGHSIDMIRSDVIEGVELQRVMDEKEWADYKFQLALRRHDAYLNVILRGLKNALTHSPSYAEEYQKARTLLQEEPFSFPLPIIERIFEQYTILPAPEQPLQVEVFTATPAMIEVGEKAVLEWRILGGKFVQLEPGMGKVEESGSISISPQTDTTYTLHILGNDERVLEKSVTVHVSVPEVVDPPVIDWFVIKPERIEAGQAAVLQWSTQGAEQVLIEPPGTPVDASGQLEVTPDGSTDYTIRAQNATGFSQPERVHLEVYTPAPPPASSTSSLDDTPGMLWKTMLSTPASSLWYSSVSEFAVALGEDEDLYFIDQKGALKWQVHVDAPIREVCFSKDGQKIITADWNGTIRCYEEYAPEPLWMIQIPGVVSAMESGQWGNRSGYFIGSWRSGVYFLDLESQDLQLVYKTQNTVSALATYPQENGFAIGDWEGGLTMLRSKEDSPKRVRVHQPVKALSAFSNKDCILLLSGEHNFYALGNDGEIVWHYESPMRVVDIAFGRNSGKCVYCTEDGKHYELRIGRVEEERYVVEARDLMGIEPVVHENLIMDDDGIYLAGLNSAGQLAFYASGTKYHQLKEDVPVSSYYMDSYGLTVLVAMGKKVMAYRNQHKLNHARPAKLDITFAASPSNTELQVHVATLVTITLTNLGDRPAAQVACTVSGRIGGEITFQVKNLLPGESYVHSCDVVPDVPGTSTISAAITFMDSSDQKQQVFSAFETIQVKHATAAGSLQ